MGALTVLSTAARRSQGKAGSRAELGLLFQAMVDAGLTRFTYYCLSDISDEIWKVTTGFTAE